MIYCACEKLTSTKKIKQKISINNKRPQNWITTTTWIIFPLSTDAYPKRIVRFPKYGKPDFQYIIIFHIKGLLSFLQFKGRTLNKVSGGGRVLSVREKYYPRQMQLLSFA